MDVRKVGARIRQCRQQRRLRQGDLAATLSVSAQAVSKWERGENAPDITVLVPLARMLGVSIEWLLGGREGERDTFSATVLCTGLNGFAQRTATMEPRDVAAWANGLFYTLTEAILQKEGVPVKYLGDGFLAYFAGTNQVERALSAALAAKGAVVDSEFVSAIHSGPIFLGTIGHPDYQSPDIIGRAVNTTFLTMRWAARNCPNGIAVTETSAKLLADKEQLQHFETIEIDGWDGSLELFTPSP